MNLFVTLFCFIHFRDKHPWLLIFFENIIFLCFIPIGLANNSSNDFCTWPASINDNNLGRGKFSELIFANKCLSRIKIAKKHLKTRTH